jgi:predicted ArsR family transcriptional regulator
MNVSPVTVRHHLSGLQADGLVAARTERRPVGRPHHVFYLTEAGEELFPRQYLSLSKRLLDQIKSTLAPETVTQLFRDMATDLIAEHGDNLEGKSGADRVAALAEILEAEGFMVSWKEKDGKVQIIEHNCPYQGLGRRHPDVCAFDHTLISMVLDTPVERTSCLLQGDRRCTYEVSATPQAT